ncbi:DUF413 domain-containing protein [Paraglaciecola sp. 2405UD69-4]|uniref:DUF413 domain-containing protein n=1 Tax=Paraglaciecola sp. 2405UD69-4 TaxID=3391836 RepID=UPI0039C93708
MTKLTRESLVNRLYNDPKNYPYGFSRSGDFSINESKALAQYGALIAALVDGKIQPSTPEDESFLACAFGKQAPETLAEKAWVKYQKRINRPKLGNIYGGHRSSVEIDGESSDEDDDISIELDDE